MTEAISAGPCCRVLALSVPRNPNYSDSYTSRCVVKTANTEGENQKYK